jgi:Fic family protein
VDFMSALMQPHKLRDRVLTWAHEEMRAGTLPPRSDAVLTAILYRGELERGEIVTLTGASERSARRLTAALLKSGVVQSETSRTPFRLAFPVELAMRFLPGLFPED